MSPNTWIKVFCIQVIHNVAKTKNDFYNVINHLHNNTKRNNIIIDQFELARDNTLKCAIGINTIDDNTYSSLTTLFR